MVICLLFYLANSQCFSARLSVNDLNSIINDCFFDNIRSTAENGGVVNNVVTDSTMRVSFCVFYRCSSAIRGGAVYFQGKDVEMLMICAFCCTITGPFGASTPHAPFSYHICTGKSFNMHISVVKCSETVVANSHHSTYIYGGTQTVQHFNSTKNAIVYTSFIYCNNPTVTNISYTTVFDNRPSTAIIILIIDGPGTIASSNIKSCTSPNNGIFDCDRCQLLITDCVIVGNSNTLFYSRTSAGQMNVRYCYISHSSTIKSGSVSIAYTFGLTNTYNIAHFSTAHCQAQNPLFIPTKTYMRLASPQNFFIILFISC